MLVHKERVVLLLLVAVVLVVGVLTLGGCQSADESTTTASDTSGTGETTVTTGGSETTTTAGTGGTETTAPGGTATTTSPESVAPVSAQFKICTDCHSDFNAFLAGQKVLTTKFGHALHLNKGFKCEDCHVVPTHQPDKIAKPTMLKCFGCHSQEANAVAPGSCSTCHPADFPLVPANHTAAGWLPAANTTGVKTVSAKHAAAATEDRKYCEMCHSASFCDSCHKTPMPHAADWVKVHPETVAKVTDGACARCHPEKWLCNDCHHKGYQNDGTGWKTQHPPIVKSAGAESCFTCHNPLTCEHCHITGQLDMNLKPAG